MPALHPLTSRAESSSEGFLYQETNAGKPFWRSDLVLCVKNQQHTKRLNRAALTQIRQKIECNFSRESSFFKASNNTKTNKSLNCCRLGASEKDVCETVVTRSQAVRDIQAKLIRKIICCSSSFQRLFG